uniref:2-aminoethylphosphonate--pyruvate transaminase-like n=1 Tax=Styela clava TaxID=7725 RepID=UPI001939D9B1|nr:2-aminoethylphosphonate--pyruvate transaminase-like [Styela clava]
MDKMRKLFTPGPLGISMRVRQQMLRDIGSREPEFIETIRFVRKKLLEIANVGDEVFTVVPMQGSGTFALESAFTTTIPRNDGKVLILDNGSYGKRLMKICQTSSIQTEIMSVPEALNFSIEDITKRLKSDQFSHLAMVHCETSTGAINPIEEIGTAVKAVSPDTIFMVDSMSGFVGIPMNLDNIDVMVTSTNKCMQGAPGFAYCFLKKELLNRCKGNSRSLSLDLFDQYEALEKTGQFRFTIPTHVMLAFAEAIRELEDEGGVIQRAKRYKENAEILRREMQQMGFLTLLDHSDHQLSYIITSFHYPKHKNFNFDIFYNKLYEKGSVIYPGKVTIANCFRIGTIGDIWPDDINKLLSDIKETMQEMEIDLPIKNV